MSRTATHDLLLHCLREEPDASRLEQLTDSDWHSLIELARSQRSVVFPVSLFKTPES